MSARSLAMGTGGDFAAGGKVSVAEDLRQTREHLVDAERRLDGVAGDLPEHEQHAARMLKGELLYAIRRLTNLIHFAEQTAS